LIQKRRDGSNENFAPSQTDGLISLACFVCLFLSPSERLQFLLSNPTCKTSLSCAQAANTPPNGFFFRNVRSTISGFILSTNGFLPRSAGRRIWRFDVRVGTLVSLLSVLVLSLWPCGHRGARYYPMIVRENNNG